MEGVGDDLKQMLSDMNGTDGLEKFSPQELADIFNFTPPPPSTAVYTVIAVVFYSSLAVLGLIANLIFCCVIWRTEKLHTVTHMLMTNLAVSNLLFLLFQPPYFLSTYLLETNWHFGTVICKASFSIGYVTVTASFYFMSLVAIDRWLAIFRRKQRICRTRGIQLTIGAWIIAVFVAIPWFYNGKVHDESKLVSFKMTRCGGESISYGRELLTITFVAQYGLPLLIMLPAYTHLAYFLWRRPTIGAQSKEKTKKVNSRRRRLIFTLIGILVIQIICWMPLFSVGVVYRYNPSFAYVLFIITSIWCLVGVLITPICYLTNDGFVHQLRLMFPCLCKKKNTNNCAAVPDTSRRLLGDSEMNLAPSTSQFHVSGTNTPRNGHVVSINDNGSAQL